MLEQALFLEQADHGPHRGITGRIGQLRPHVGDRRLLQAEDRFENLPLPSARADEPAAKLSCSLRQC